MSLVTLHEAEHDHAVKEGDWTVMRASKNRWVGKDKAIRELVKFSRVSRVSMHYTNNINIACRYRSRGRPSSSTVRCGAI
jgi:hypothetical protein